MTPLAIQVFASVVLLAIVYVAVRKAATDGFFATFCTAGVLYVAFRFADLRWEANYLWFVEILGMNADNAIERFTALSASYWTGFVMVVLPAMFYVKLLTRERVPFPSWLERGGNFVMGVLCGVLFFATILVGISRFGFFREHLQTPLHPFRVLIELIQIF